MNQTLIIFFCIICIFALLAIIVYQQITFRIGLQKDLWNAADQLQAILDNDSDEKVMVFTAVPAVTALLAQINRLLDARQQVSADYRHTALASKKLLSNISHDIKTPITVILGYLEILQLQQADHTGMLRKVEQQAVKVADLVNQFFSLAKLEAGDAPLPLSCTDVAACCRESVLEFYALLTENQFDVVLHIPEKPVFVLGNYHGLQRIFSNLISMPSAMVLPETIWKLPSALKKTLFLLILSTKERVLNRNLRKRFSTDCLPWKIPETATCRAMVWDLPSPEIWPDKWKGIFC